MRVGRFFVTMARRPHRVWFLHARGDPVNLHSSATEHTVLFDPLWKEPPSLQREIRYQLGWIGQRRLPGDPPAAEILTKLWPGDKQHLDTILNNMAQSELMLGREDDNESAR